MSWTAGDRIDSIELLGFLPPLFRTVDVKKLHPHPAQWLGRMARQGRVQRLLRGRYLNRFKCSLTDQWPAVEEIACFLRSPSYVSGVWALSWHSVLGQFPRACTLVTLGTAVGHHHQVVLDTYRLEYSRIKRDLFFGFEDKGGFHLALPEKALLDCLYLDGRLPFADELDTSLLDRDRLHRFAAPFPSRVRSALAAVSLQGG